LLCALTGLGYNKKKKKGGRPVQMTDPNPEHLAKFFQFVIKNLNEYSAKVQAN